MLKDVHLLSPSIVETRRRTVPNCRMQYPTLPIFAPGAHGAACILILRLHVLNRMSERRFRWQHVAKLMIAAG